MKEKILITGFNGVVANTLAKKLDYSRYEVSFLTTDPKHCAKNIFYWNIKNKYIDTKALINTKHIIHLSGFNIANSWTAKNKQKMFSSRVETSKLIYTECKQHNINLYSFISASAMGYYGFDGNGIKKENDKPGNDWMAQLCVHWEKAADNFNSKNTRVIKLRLGLIIDKNSGILQKTCLGLKFKTGLIFGDGSQNFPWIDIKDVAKFIVFTLQKKNIKGVFNLASPQQISYYNFMKTLQKMHFKNSILIKIPKSIITFFLPQKKSLLFNNINLSTNKLKATGFEWRYPTIEQSIKEALI